MNPVKFIRLALWGRRAIDTTVTTLRVFRVSKSRLIKDNKNEDAVKTVLHPRYAGADGQTGLNEKQVTHLLFWGGISSVVLCFVSYEYFEHLSLVPITNRRHCVFLTKLQEILYQSYALERASYRTNHKVCREMCIKKNESDKSCEMIEVCEIRDEIGYRRIITDPKDERVIMVKRIVKRLCEACNYFEPGNEDYYDKLKVFVVESKTVNAYASFGGYIVVYTGLIDHYKKHMEAGRCGSIEDAIAGILAHEFSHTLAQHSTEQLFHISHLFFYIAMALSGDVILFPQIKEAFDATKSRSMEYEADHMALYLMKRANYDIKTWSTTIDLLTRDEKNNRIQESNRIENSHPNTRDRVKAILRHIPEVEKAFEEKYEVKKGSTIQNITEYILNWIGVLFT